MFEVRGHRKFTMAPSLSFQQITLLAIVQEASKRVLQHTGIAGNVWQMTQMQEMRYRVKDHFTVVEFLCHHHCSLLVQ